MKFQLIILLLFPVFAYSFRENKNFGYEKHQKDFDSAIFYLKSTDLNKSEYFAKKLFRASRYTYPQFSRESSKLYIRCNDLCSRFYSAFYDKKDFRKSLYYLQMLNSRFQFRFCGTGSENRKKDLYLKIADCHEKLGHKKQAESFRRRA